MTLLTVCLNKSQVNDSRSFVIENDNTHWPMLYNEVLRKCKQDIILFLGETELLPGSIDKILPLFDKYKYVSGIIYGEFQEPVNYIPNYPFFLNTKNVKNHWFNESLSDNYNYDFIKRLQSHMVYHLPETIYA